VWWNASTVISSQSARVSTPPSPIWSMMSVSTQSSSAATRRTAARSSCLAPGKTVSRVDRRTGRQSAGSEQSHTRPRANGAIWSCSITRVSTRGGVSPRRIAAAAASAKRSHDWISRS